MATETAETMADHVLFVSVTVSSWRGQFEVTGGEVRVDDRAVARDMVADPRWKLLPTPWRLRFGKIENAARREVDRKALPFPLTGLSVIPRTAAGDVFAAIDVQAAALAAAADEFVEQWPTILTDLEGKVPADLWPGVRAKLPTAVDLRKKFGIKTRVVPVGGLGATLDDADAGAYAREIQAKTTQFIDETAAVMAAGLRDELHAAAAAVTDRMTDKGVLKAATLANLGEAFDKLAAFKFLTGADVQGRLRDAHRRLKEMDPSTLNDSTRKGDGLLAAELATLIRGVTDGLAADRKFAGVGRAARSVL